jgi:NAD dependent epimerase/dehydratase
MDLKNKKILVTGADGFIGSHLTEMLLEKSCNVKALSYYNSFNNWGWLEDIPANNKLEIVIGDIRDSHFVNQIIKDVDIVFHLAALIAIPYSYQAPESYVDTNIKGTLNICQAAKENGKTRVIHTSTSEVYGTAKYVPIDEKHPKQPQSPYSATKIAADALALSFYNAFNLPVTIARPFNTYGPRQSARAVIPTIITQIASGKKEICLGNVTPTRDFNYVKDTCRALIAIAEIQEITGIEINIASNNEISIKALFDLICELMGSDAVLQTDEKRLRPESSEVFRLCGDNTLLKQLTGYEPAYSLKDGLQETINWYLAPENLKKYKTHLYNV